MKRKLQIADLLIAVTDLQFSLELYTDNKKHYDFIQGLNYTKKNYKTSFMQSYLEAMSTCAFIIDLILL
jgi:hypothetical protein